MSSGILNIASAGVASFQRSIQTIGHNITNVNTDGYSRQRVNLTQRPPEFSGGNYVGTGVKTGMITRSYDEFLTKQVRTGTSSQSQLEVFNRLATQVDNFTADSATSLNSSIQKFFDSVHEVADNPTSVASRQVMLGDMSDLVERVQTLDSRLTDLRNEVNTNIQATIKEVNTMTSSLAQINTHIIQAQTLGEAPNDLLDQRDQMLESLAKKIGITVVTENNGAVDVFTSSGQPLVVSADATQLQLSQPGRYSDPHNADIALVNTAGAKFIISDSLNGGELGGLLDFRNQILDPAQNALGATVAGMIGDLNAVQQQGYDLNGQPGQALFSPSSFTFAAYPKAGTSNAVLSVTLGTVPPATPTVPTANGLTGSDYQLDYDGSQYTLTRLSDGARVYQDSTLPSAPIEGMNLSLDGGPLTAGASFLIQPTRHVAESISANINILNDPKLIAASSHDYAVGDNGNALAMASLATSKNLGNSTATYQESYSTIVGDVATKTHSSQINLESQTKLLDQAKAARTSVSGVNLDEEAANLVQYQQSYQAAAQLVTVVNQMFDALMGAVRS